MQALFQLSYSPARTRSIAGEGSVPTSAGSVRADPPVVAVGAGWRAAACVTIVG